MIHNVRCTIIVNRKQDYGCSQLDMRASVCLSWPVHVRHHTVWYPQWLIDVCRPCDWGRRRMLWKAILFGWCVANGHQRHWRVLLFRGRKEWSLFSFPAALPVVLNILLGPVLCVRIGSEFAPFHFYNACMFLRLSRGFQQTREPWLTHPGFPASDYQHA